LKSFSCKINRTAEATILYSQYSQYDQTGVNRYTVAVRITQGFIEIIGQCIDTTTNIILTELTEPATTTTVRQQSTLLAQAAGTIKRLFLQAALPAIYRLSGNAKFIDGAIPTKLRVSDHDTGQFITDLVPNQQTGAYLLDQGANSSCDLTIYRDGYRPLTHGPVTPLLVPA
jgi:hypothetical protein